MATTRTIFRFELMDDVYVTSFSSDPGGFGYITGREYKDFKDKDAVVKYRVRIPDNPGQDRSLQKKGKDFRGFWYSSEVVVSEEEGEELEE